jgi:hypothetical protein
MADPLTIADVFPSSNESWAIACDEQAHQIAEYIKNWMPNARDTAELTDLAARLHLRAIQLRNAP